MCFLTETCDAWKNIEDPRAEFPCVLEAMNNRTVAAEKWEPRHESHLKTRTQPRNGTKKVKEAGWEARKGTHSLRTGVLLPRRTPASGRERMSFRVK